MDQCGSIEREAFVSLSTPRIRRSRAAISALLGLLLLVNLATSLYQLPLNRVVESRLCRDYYREKEPSRFGPDDSISEDLCKLDDVQKSLAWIQGAMDTAWIIGDFVMTIPLGFMAEKYGQRAVLWLNIAPRVFMLSWAVMVGYFDQLFPTKAIIAGPFLSVFGGDCVFNSMTYALAAGITDDYVLRATYFGWMSSVSYVVALLGPALASATMTVMLWLPFFIGIILLALAVPAITLLPDHPHTADANVFGNQEEVLSHPLISSPLLKAQTLETSALQAISMRFGELSSILASHPRNLTLLFISFFLTSLASSDTKLLVQYISKRYHWSFASAGYLLSSKAVMNFVLLTVIIPWVLRSRHTRSLRSSSPVSTDRANLRYAQLCLAISVIGALAIGLASELWFLIPSLLLYALGSALPVFTLSLLKSSAIAPEEYSNPKSTDVETHLFSITMMIKTLGSLVGAPLMAALWIRGISLGDAALGVPYFTSSASYAAAMLVLSKIRA
ncbi:major facilitator superfamily transporter [Truncatella angustata]|uniref:Major facilitator superfamily transporter n=1 Tax=Truncatella angustata TaxID=152316 RepID=A0A9P8UH40_9PEZI|nr:major facilitator superfamily transporter [Truncatella angustata]KAH6652010.1 major facilitator superfamily transporter [Truncatella angustata]